MRLARVIGRVRPETGGAAKWGAQIETAPDLAVRGRFFSCIGYVTRRSRGAR